MMSDGFIIRSLNFLPNGASVGELPIALEINDEAVTSREVDGDDYVLSLDLEEIGAVYFNDYEARQLLEAVKEVVDRHEVREEQTHA
jgi:hypothetical protein